MRSIGIKVGEQSGYGTLHRWAEPRRPKRSYRVKRLLCAFGKCWKEYFDSSSLVGYKYLSETPRPWIERILWIVIHATTMFALGFMVTGLWQHYVCTPVVTVVDSDNYPSTKLDFPGIAICSINRMSRRAVENLSLKIKISNLIDKTSEEIFELISSLRILYDTAFEQDELTERKARRQEAHKMFVQYFGEGYDITEIIESLTPKCADIMLACTYRSIFTNCSELLAFRKTQNGFCCTFNYAREPDDIPSSDFKEYARIEPNKIGIPGVANGLTVVLEPFLEDYLFPFLPTTGWVVTIFNPGDYPDNTSGGVSEAIVAPSSESFLELDVSSIYSENEIRPVSVNRRKCIFTDETDASKTSYTYSDCIVDCRATAIWKACRCRPFFLPRRDSRKVCNTEDEPCLHAHKSTWWSVLPHTPDAEESLSYDKAIGDRNESLKCTNCYPTCTDTRYYLQMQATPLEPGRQYHTELLRSFQTKNQSILHIYFKKFGSVRLKQDMGYYWYELISDIGGTCGVFVGFSLLSIVELLYFIIQRTCQCGCSKIPESKDQLKVNITTVHGGLYWNELLNDSRIHFKSRTSRRRRLERH
ncbi:sodium channel protein Nach-like isoform X2 [Diachasmimorpha longicaudata]|uniref:sodium channel protein Nach-like isoform X2 n=1 Tax=Diachasmimorpha longicaudata TaxID=58733 RepID=UPI0030B8DCFF